MSLLPLVASGLAAPLRPLRGRVAASLMATVGDAEPNGRLLAFREPAGDPGWFGPSSLAWTVHAELGPMLVGGLSALLLQTLHPLVMQGVADHSNYQEDPFGRLRRTADFLAVTTYGGCGQAAGVVRDIAHTPAGSRDCP